MTARDRWAARSGWHLTAERVEKSPDGLGLPAQLNRIEAAMAAAAPEVQWTMNNTLAGIGIHAPGLRKRAIAIGEKPGIYRDFPVSKGRTSPFAPIWITPWRERMPVRKGALTRAADAREQAEPLRDRLLCRRGRCRASITRTTAPSTTSAARTTPTSWCWSTSRAGGSPIA